MDKNTLDKIRLHLQKARHVVFLGGAGLSVASGIPDFRSPNGLYNKKREDGMRYEDLLSSDYFFSSPKGFYDFYWEEMVCPSAKPNKAHLALAEYEKHHSLAILTQNIDGLHQLAGSKEVYEIHGSALRNYCMKCGKTYPSDYIFESREPVPHCTCGGVIRPDITLYEEMLPEDAVEHAVRAISDADMMIIAGTSLTVYPAASFIDYFRGRRLAILNREPLAVHMRAETISLTEDMDRVFAALAAKEGIAL